MTTEKKLISAAAKLLDDGGEKAVTLRAVGQAVGVSHNAPYKHFKNRDALLAAVAATDLSQMAATLQRLRQSKAKPLKKLNHALKDLMKYGSEHPARYQLLLNDSRFAAPEGDLGAAAERHFAEFDAIVRECQAAGELPLVGHATLAGLLFATVHGLVCLEASGRWIPEKGPTNVDVILSLIAT
jgi:AcrR family transcriptional regulator